MSDATIPVMMANSTHSDMPSMTRPMVLFDSYVTIGIILYGLHGYSLIIQPYVLQAMIVKKLLNHMERHLTTLGLDGTKELPFVHIPGLANPFDRRCGPVGQKRNFKSFRRALTLESRLEILSTFPSMIGIVMTPKTTTPTCSYQSYHRA